MSSMSIPRILVADDDHGVMAAYRCALGVETPGSNSIMSDATNRLGAELFGPSIKADAAMNWRVDFVYQGQDAFKVVCDSIMKSAPYALVFLDVRMPPGIDGCETARRIRQVDQNVHIVFVSGYSDYSEEELADAGGPAEKVSFMQKPVALEQLRAKALEFAGRHRMVAAR